MVVAGTRGRERARPPDLAAGLAQGRDAARRHAKPLPASEAALIRWWVDQGARFDQKLSELEITPEVQPAIEAVVGPLRARRAHAAGRERRPRPTGRRWPRRLDWAHPSCRLPAAIISSSCIAPTRAPRFGDAELAALRPLAPQTVWLDLSGTGITDAGLSTVAQFRNLTRLHLNRTRISDTGLNNWQACSNSNT